MKNDPKNAPGQANPPSRRRRPLSRRAHRLIHWLHIYISMLSLLVILFFALTGITLNHPNWIFGDAEVEEGAGTLPAGWLSAGAADWPRVEAHLRSEHDVRGYLADARATATEGVLMFRAPGYTAEVEIDAASGGYEIKEVSLGTLVMFNELHRGQDGGTSWRLLIDAVGVFLAVLSLTGFGLLLYLKKYRRSALSVMAMGAVALVILMQIAT